MFFDTHTHLLDERFDEDRDRLLEMLPARGIGNIAECASDMDTAIRAVALAHAHSAVYAVVGVHPHSAAEWDDTAAAQLGALAKQPKVVAIGEIGLDYHYDFCPRELQQRVFEEQLELAGRCGLPIVVHSREATADTLRILKKHPDAHGILHCFSGSVETMEELVKMGYYIALGGSVTFRNANKTVEVAARMPLGRMLIETDCPYMTPVPHRGKRNTPEYVKLVAQKIAEIRGVDVREIEAATTQNAKDVFDIKYCGDNKDLHI